MANHLTPKSIRDKNGKHTTVHVRSERTGFLERVRGLTASRAKSPVMPMLDGLYGSSVFDDKQIADHFPEASTGQIFNSAPRYRDTKPSIQFISHKLPVVRGRSLDKVANLVADYLQDSYDVEMVWTKGDKGSYVSAVISSEQDESFTEEDIVNSYESAKDQLKMFNGMGETTRTLGKRFTLALREVQAMSDDELLTAASGSNSDVIRAIPYAAAGREVNGQVWLNIVTNPHSTPGAVRGVIESSSNTLSGTEGKAIDALETIKAYGGLDESERTSLGWRIDGIRRVMDARAKLAS